MWDSGYEPMSDGVRDLGGALNSLCDKWDIENSMDFMSTQMTQMRNDSMSYQHLPGITGFSDSLLDSARRVRGW